MTGKIVGLVDSKTDMVYRYIGNGVFYDGRKKALTEVAKDSVKASMVRKGSSLNGSKNITKYTVKEDYHYNIWMTR